MPAKTCESCINFGKCPLSGGYRDTCWLRNPRLWLDIQSIPPVELGEYFYRMDANSEWTVIEIFSQGRLGKAVASLGTECHVQLKNAIGELQGPIRPEGE